MMRRYNRWWARFDQPDPYDGSYDATNPQSFNRYAYVQNDPVNFIDPSGLLLGDLGLNHYTVTVTIGMEGISGGLLQLMWNSLFAGGSGGGGGTGLDAGGGGGGHESGHTNPQNPVEGQNKWNDCMNKHLSEEFPEGKPKPTGAAVGLARTGGLGNIGDSAMILALWAKESSFDLRPRNDHGPMQLTSWWSNYSNRNGLNLIVPGAYDSFGRPADSANRDRRFEGNIDANIMTGGNIIRHSRNALGQSYRQIGYGYGPGPDRATRNTYADHAARLQQRYANFLNCL